MTHVLSRLAGERIHKVSPRVEWMEYMLLCATVLIVPLIFRHPQILVGSAVNFVLIMAAINVSSWRKLIPLIILPGISATAGGCLFGCFTFFLLYMLPFIWLGNGVLVFLFKWCLVVNKRNFFVSLIFSSLAKAICLFIAASILVIFNVVPSFFLYAMGPIQIATSLLGGLCVLPIMTVHNRILH